ncbi:crosslink repair DNA glycosylase YcaQ family protein [Streptomyces sp. MST-110588]|uniref:DNA glycosylase AlkZ-like family protein n=1 Tax=Streptomyces sp. MST-110588 TaxID=2833628 RepID=UPI001F5CCC90|nr:crosslink repair DNA glycosylase YcaQ family protein [Streptomyces sp. MST-110588]UNO40652.1 winged helix DNA-binding domain-containing protein [Streptomyces sp. MST-110588]
MTGCKKVTYEQVLAWRLRQQGLAPRTDASAAEIVGRLAGVQAQVASSAELAVATRQRKPAAGGRTAAGSAQMTAGSAQGASASGVREGLAARSLVKTWAMRGTLHLLRAEEAGAYLSLLGAARTWEKPAWQKAFGVSPRQVAAMGEAVEEILDGRVLTRQELTDAVLARDGLDGLGEQLASGWSTVLKPLAWTGRLCQGPAQGQKVTFAAPRSWVPGWGGIPDPQEAARVVIPAYLRAHGPATPAAFDAWLLRGATRKPVLRGWFEELGDQLTEVEVDGERGAYVLAEDADALAATDPSREVRLLAGFDQYVLGPGTADTRLIAPSRRKAVSRAAGWISPVVVHGGRVVGVWEFTDEEVVVTLFEEAGDVPADALEAEAAHLARCTGRDRTVAVRKD